MLNKKNFNTSKCEFKYIPSQISSFSIQWSRHRRHILSSITRIRWVTEKPDYKFWMTGGHTVMFQSADNNRQALVVKINVHNRGGVIALQSQMAVKALQLDDTWNGYANFNKNLWSKNIIIDEILVVYKIPHKTLIMHCSIKSQMYQYVN